MKIFKVIAKRYGLQQKKKEYIGEDKFNKFGKGTAGYWKDYYDVFIYEMKEDWKYVLIEEYPYQYCNCEKREGLFSLSSHSMTRCPHCRKLYPLKESK